MGLSVFPSVEVVALLFTASWIPARRVDRCPPVVDSCAPVAQRDDQCATCNSGYFLEDGECKAGGWWGEKMPSHCCFRANHQAVFAMLFAPAVARPTTAPLEMDAPNEAGRSRAGDLQNRSGGSMKEEIKHL